MDLLYICIALCVVIGYSLADECKVNDCGKICRIGPAVKGRRAKVTFNPNERDNTGSVTWYIPSGQSWIEVSDVLHKGYKIYNNDSVYTMEMPRLTTTGHLDVNVNYKKGKHTCSSEYIRLDISSELKGCGLLYRPTHKRIGPGDDVKLRYMPSDAVINIPNDYVRYWVGPDGRRLDSRDYTEDEHAFNDEVTLTIRDFRAEMNGNYSIQCTSRSHPQNVSTNSVYLHIPVKPNTPQLFSTTKAKWCPDNYICGIYEERVEITCVTDGGTEPVFGNITVENRTATTRKKSPGTFYINSPFREVFHERKIKCEVWNNATDKMIVNTSTLYVLRSPKQPTISMPTIKEGQPINITCQSIQGRPAPNLTMHIGDELLNLTQRNTIDSSNKYDSMLSLYTMKREWNGQNIKCCQTHPALLTEESCSQKRIITYKYPPSSVEFMQVQIQKTKDSQYELELKCVVTNANPECKAEIYGDIAVSSNKGLETKSYGNVTMATIIVKATDNGKQMFCRPVCDEFPDIKMNNVYIVTVPTPPNIILSETNSPIRMSEGETLALKCIVEGIPESNISWNYPEVNENTVTVWTCGQKQKCLDVLAVTKSHEGNYTCIATNIMFGTSQKDVVLRVEEGVEPSPAEADQHRPEGSRNDESDEGPNYYNQVNRGLLQEQENETRDTYASVIPKSQRQPQASTSAAPERKQAADQSELLYADLELHESDTPPRRQEIKASVPETEYVAIDFTKSANLMEQKRADPEEENIYANQ